MTYQPLILKADKTGIKTATVTAYEKQYSVEVARRDNDYSIYVSGADLRGTVLAGVVHRSGSVWILTQANLDGVLRHSYTESGTLNRNVERVLFSFLGDVEYRQRQEAKTPEELAAERAQVEANLVATQQRRIVNETEALLATLNELVPNSTIHYAVEQARRALTTLASTADGIKTKGLAS